MLHGYYDLRRRRMRILLRILLQHISFVVLAGVCVLRRYTHIGRTRCVITYKISIYSRLKLQCDAYYKVTIMVSPLVLPFIPLGAAAV